MMQLGLLHPAGQPRPWPAAQVANLRSFAAHGFDLVALPGLRPDEPNRFNRSHARAVAAVLATMQAAAADDEHRYGGTARWPPRSIRRRQRWLPG